MAERRPIRPAARAARVSGAVGEVAAGFASDSLARGRREHLDAADFAALRDAGFLLCGLPAAAGGLWQGLPGSVRLYADLIHTIAGADPSVALVAVMHPAVLTAWLAGPDPGRSDPAWHAQCGRVFDSVADGHWWGTATSEPGSGGDKWASRATAVRDGGTYRLTGDKHFVSGAGQVAFMLTMARVGEHADVFVLDMRDVAWDGTTGCTLTARWDGVGMSATQSHAFRFQNFPAERFALPAVISEVFEAVGLLSGVLFLAVGLAIVERAVAWSAGRFAERGRTGLRSFERSEWVAGGNDAWLMRQAFEGAIRAVETTDPRANVTVARAKLAGAGLAEACLTRLGRVVGGSAYSRSAPLAQWGEDVRALGYLRPPWGLAVEQLLEASLPA